MDDFAVRVLSFHEKTAAGRRHRARSYRLPGDRSVAVSRPRNRRHEEPDAGVSNVQQPARYGIKVRQKSAGSLLAWLEGSLDATAAKSDLGVQPAA